MRSITLVCGPPCAGKTTFAHQQAGARGLVLDFDEIAAELGSTDRWRHQPGIKTRAEEVLMRRAKQASSKARSSDVLVIRSAADPKRRAELAERLGADRVIVLNPGLEECLTRARADNRPDGTEAVIRAWFDRYQPAPALDTAGDHHVNADPQDGPEDDDEADQAEESDDDPRALADRTRNRYGHVPERPELDLPPRRS